MDQVDLKILSILIEDVRTPIKAIAEKVFMSPAAVSARINAMRDQGIIKMSYTVVSPKALGYSFSSFILVKVRSEQRQQFESFLKSSYHVLYAGYVTGSYSAIIKAAFATTEEAYEFTRQLEQYGETNMHVVLNQIVEPRVIRITTSEGETDTIEI